MIPRPDRMGGGGRRPLPPPGPSSRIQKGGYPPMRAETYSAGADWAVVSDRVGDLPSTPSAPRHQLPPDVEPATDFPHAFWYGLAIGSFATAMIWILILLLAEAS